MPLLPWDLYFGKDEEDAKRPLNRFLTKYGVIRTFITMVALGVAFSIWVEQFMEWGPFSK